jgi:hypothetical protein
VIGSGTTVHTARTRGGTHRGRRLLAIAAAAAAIGAGLAACSAQSLGIVPPRIAADCSVDVSDALNAWMASMPNGMTLHFGGGCYRINHTLELDDRVNLEIDGEGAVFKTDDPTGDGSPLSSPSKAARSRDHWRIVGGSNIHLHDLVIVGANPNAGTGDLAYVAALEAQHGIDVQGSQNIEIDHVTITRVYGDFVYFGKELAGTTFSSGRLHDSIMFANGRQGVSLTAATNIEIDHNTITDTRRSTFDLEPNGQTWGVDHAVIAYNRVGPGRLLFVAGGGEGPENNITILNNTLTGRAMTMEVQSDDVSRRHDFWVVGNTSDTGWGSTTAAAIVLQNIDRIIVNGNVQSLQAGRGDSGVRASGSTGVHVDHNSFIGAATVMYNDVAGEVVCSNRLVAGSPFDQPVVCPRS